MKEESAKALLKVGDLPFQTSRLGPLRQWYCRRAKLFNGTEERAQKQIHTSTET